MVEFVGAAAGYETRPIEAAVQRLDEALAVAADGTQSDLYLRFESHRR